MNEGPALATVLRGSAVPYGYTLTVLASHSILADSHGSPDVLEILVFVVGAMLGFATLGADRAVAAAAGAENRAGGHDPRRHVPRLRDRGRVRRLGADRADPGHFAWGLGAYVATVLYLAITSIEITVARRVDEDAGTPD